MNDPLALCDIYAALQRLTNEGLFFERVGTCYHCDVDGLNIYGPEELGNCLDCWVEQVQLDNVLILN